jgi:hypothetical protein
MYHIDCDDDGSESTCKSKQRTEELTKFHGVVPKADEHCEAQEGRRGENPLEKADSLGLGAQDSVSQEVD